MHVVEKTTPEAYVEIIDRLSASGTTDSRIGDTKEESSVIVRSYDPRTRMFIRPNINWAFGLQECFAYWNGLNPGRVHRYNSNMERYIQDDGGMLGSAYGRYLRHLPHDQISRVIDQLSENGQTRRAVINIHNAKYEDYDSNDVACTMYLNFMLRDGKLNLIVSLRSQDMLWGYPYDTQAFQWIQEMIAGVLDVDLGFYEHRMDSCHYYTEHEDKLMSDDFEYGTMPDARVDNPKLLMNVLKRELRHARNDKYPLLSMGHSFYNDWLRLMAAYEYERFHDRHEYAVRIAEDVNTDIMRTWITDYVSE